MQVKSTIRSRYRMRMAENFKVIIEREKGRRKEKYLTEPRVDLYVEQAQLLLILI